MTIQAFMTSGILEKYALGMVSEDQKQEVLEMVSQHEELKAELAAIRQTLQGYVLSHQITPPAGLKEKVLAIADAKVPVAGRKEMLTAERTPSYAPTQKRKESRANIAAPLVIGLLGLALLALGFTAFSFFQDIEKSKQAAEDAQKEVAQSQQQLVTEQAANASLQSKLDFYLDRNNRLFLLKGTQRAPGARALLYWNNTAKTGALDMAAVPSLPVGRAPVLWASANGSTYKIGLLKSNEPDALTPLTFVENADFFFATEEENADVEKPNRTRIILSGN